MSNSLSDSKARYIVIGVSEKKTTKEKIIKNITKDKNRLTSENLITQLRNYMPAIPNINILTEQIKARTFIDIIEIIPNAYDLPYTTNKICEYQEHNGKKRTLQKDWIYSRNGSRNTGIDEWVSKSVLEKLFARKNGDNLSATERFALYLDDVSKWKRPKTSGVFFLHGYKRR